MRRWWIVALALLAIGCDGGGHILVVDLRTDVIPGAEFDAVTVTLDDRAPLALSPDTSADYVAGARLVELGDVASGTHELRVTLLDGTDPSVGRLVLVTVDVDTAVTVVITRDCRGVVCPAAGGDATALACLGGRCVDPGCTPETPERCADAECSVDSDCTATADCAVPTCSAGTCLLGDDDSCGVNTYCDPDFGCRSSVMEDAGLEDAAVDAGVTDAGFDAGDAGPCVDMDGDGFSTCAGDCLDADPFSYPGAVEVCGDGLVNDCGAGPADGTCRGLGTFVSETAGDDSNPGTRASPLATISAGIANATAIGGGVDVFVSAGVYTEAVTVANGANLYGGFHPTTWALHPAANMTRINATTTTGVLFPTGVTLPTEIAGFNIRGLSGPASASAVTVREDANAVIRRNRIEAPLVSGASYGIHVNPTGAPSTQRPFITLNEVLLNQSTNGWGAGRGSYGIRAVGDASVVDNTVELISFPTHQYGIVIVNAGPSALVAGNSVTSPGTATIAIGLHIAGSGGVVRDNVVALNRCSSTCYGISAGNATAPLRIHNNVVFAGFAEVESTACLVEVEGVPASTDIVVHSNFFGGGAGGTSHGVVISLPGTTLPVGRFFNNIIRSGIGDSRYGVRESNAGDDPARFENNALFLETGGAPTAAALYRDDGTTDLTILDVARLSYAANNRETDCGLTTPTPGGDLHLSSTSECVDRGTATEAPSVDFEGDPRPIGPGFDIGPDEHDP